MSRRELFVASKKADAGIGTLIIFLAMIIVASVAANVLVQTATSLQNQALKTGKMAAQSVSTYAQPMGVVGTDGSDHDVEDFTLQLKLTPGGSGIKLENAMLSLELYNTSIDYTYKTGDCNRSASGYSVDASNQNGTFTVKYLVTGANYQEGYLQRGDIVRLCFGSPHNVIEDEEVSVRFVPSIGMPTVVSFVTDTVMYSTQVRLYP